MEAIAGSILSKLHRADAELAGKYARECGKGRQGLLHGRRLDAKAVARDLDDQVVGGIVEPGGKLEADHVFATGDAHFDAAAIGGPDDHGGDAVIHEVGEVNGLTFALEDGGEFEAHIFQVRFECIEFGLWHSKENSIADGLASDRAVGGIPVLRVGVG